MPSPLRIAFVTGTTPDKWARYWRERRRESLELVPVTEPDQHSVLASGDVDMLLGRLPLDTEGRHCVRLYEEVPVVVASREHFLAAAEEEISTGDLTDEQLVLPHSSGWRPEAEQLDWPEMSPADAIETVAAGTGIAIMPMSVARLHQRKDVLTRIVSDLPSTTIALVWDIDRDDEVIQSFVGITRGRTANSSR